MADTSPKTICTCLKRQDVKHAASAVRDTGRELFFVEEEDGCCTVFGTDGFGNAVDIRSVATLTVTSANESLVRVDPVDGMTFRLCGVGLTPPKEPVDVTVAVAPKKDAPGQQANVVIPCDVTKAPATPGYNGPRLIVTRREPVVG